MSLELIISFMTDIYLITNLSWNVIMSIRCFG